MADNTDVYAFVSPDAPDTVTLIANFIPFQKPDGGPNFYPFDPNVVYEIHIDNNGDAVEDITFQWRFTTEVRNPATFLYNTGPVTSLDDPDLNVRLALLLHLANRLGWLRRGEEGTVHLTTNRVQAFLEKTRAEQRQRCQRRRDLPQSAGACAPAASSASRGQRHLHDPPAWSRPGRDRHRIRRQDVIYPRGRYRTALCDI